MSLSWNVSDPSYQIDGKNTPELPVRYGEKSLVVCSSGLPGFRVNVALVVCYCWRYYVVVIDGVAGNVVNVVVSFAAAAAAVVVLMVVVVPSIFALVGVGVVVVVVVVVVVGLVVIVFDVQIMIYTPY